MIGSLAADTWLLVQLQWLLAWNQFRSSKLLRKIFAVIGFLAATLGGGWFSALVGYGAGILLRRLPQYGFEPLIPGLILTAVTLILLVNSFGIALGSLYLSNDLELLMTAPVNRRAVLISKLLDGMTFYVGLGLILGGPALVTYGIGLGYGPAYYVLVALCLLATPLLPAAWGALLVMIVARFAPARRVREVMGLAAALFGVTCSIISNTSRFWSQNSNVDRTNFEALFALVRQVADLPIPTMVAGHGLTAAGMGNLFLGLLNLVGYGVMSVGSFAVVVWLADKLYANGWLRMQSSGTANRSAKRVARDAKQTGLLGDAAPPMAIALKDWRILPRDLRNFAQFLTPLFFLPVIYLNFFSGGRNGFNALEQANELGNGTVDFTNIFVAAGILATASLVVNRAAAIGISMEGKSYWLLKTAPISAFELLLGKFLVAMIPFTILSTLMFLGVAIWRSFSILGTGYGLFGILLLGTGNLAIETGMAVPWAKLDWSEPRHMNSGWGALIAFIVSAVSGIFAGACLGLPIVIKFLAPELEWLGWVVGPLLAVAVVVAFAAPMVWIGLKRLPYAGEG
jgi:ABC-2 type transport system permease protein